MIVRTCSTSAIKILMLDWGKELYDSWLDTATGVGMCPGHVTATRPVSQPEEDEDDEDAWDEYDSK
jgi:hypothetical protein